MQLGLFEYISNQLPSIFTGLTMAIIGLSVYEAGDGYFLSGGSFRGKHEAVIILLGSLIGVSLFTPQIKSIWVSILPQLHPAQIVGGLLLLGMVAVNETTGWNHLELKSIVFYIAAAVLIVRPDVIYLVF